jgi:hypothetical protein
MPPETDASHTGSSHTGRSGVASEVRLRVRKSGCSFASLNLCVNEPQQIRKASRALALVPLWFAVSQVVGSRFNLFEIGGSLRDFSVWDERETAMVSNFLGRAIRIG